MSHPPATVAPLEETLGRDNRTPPTANIAIKRSTSTGVCNPNFASEDEQFGGWIRQQELHLEREKRLQQKKASRYVILFSSVFTWMYYNTFSQYTSEFVTIWAFAFFEHNYNALSELEQRKLIFYDFLHFFTVKKFKIFMNMLFCDSLNGRTELCILGLFVYVEST